jgi:hypothetical protein
MIDDYDYMGRRVVLLDWVWFGTHPVFFLFLFNQDFFEGAESLKLLNGKNDLFADFVGLRLDLCLPNSTVFTIRC